MRRRLLRYRARLLWALLRRRLLRSRLLRCGLPRLRRWLRLRSRALRGGCLRRVRAFRRDRLDTRRGLLRCFRPRCRRLLRAGARGAAPAAGWPPMTSDALAKKSHMKIC